MVVSEDEVAVEPVERIGRIDFSVRRGEDRPESLQRQADRADALAAWLFSEWRREQAEVN